MATTRAWSGANLRAIREGKNLSREALGYLSGTSGASIARWELGSNVPLATSLAALANTLEVDIDDFFVNGKEAA